jgi:hypothetical protein
VDRDDRQAHSDQRPARPWPQPASGQHRSPSPVCGLRRCFMNESAPIAKTDTTSHSDQVSGWSSANDRTLTRAHVAGEPLRYPAFARFGWRMAFGSRLRKWTGRREGYYSCAVPHRVVRGGDRFQAGR